MHACMYLKKFVSPSCIWPDGVWKYFDSFSTALLLPPIVFLICAAMYSLAWAWSHCVKRREVWKIRLAWMVVDEAGLRQYGISLLGLACPFLVIVYNGLCLKVLETFSCLSLRDGTQRLQVAPDTVCYTSSEHIVMITISVVCTVVYVIGIPAFIFGSMQYAARKRLFNDPEFLQALGFLYARYDPQFYLWELAFLLRRFLFCACLVGLRDHPFTQGGAVIAVVTASTLLQFVIRPFLDPRVNLLDCMCCCSLGVHVVSLLYYNNTAFIASDKLGPRHLEWGLLAINLTTVLLILALFVAHF